MELEGFVCCQSGLECLQHSLCSWWCLVLQCSSQGGSRANCRVRDTNPVWFWAETADLCALGLGKCWESDAAGVKGSEVKMERIRISSDWVFCEIEVHRSNGLKGHLMLVKLIKWADLWAAAVLLSCQLLAAFFPYAPASLLFSLLPLIWIIQTSWQCLGAFLLYLYKCNKTGSWHPRSEVEQCRGESGKGQEAETKTFWGRSAESVHWFWSLGAQGVEVGFGGSSGHRDLVAWRKEGENSQCVAKFWDKCRA